jgi:thiamine pyrophosphate-dependent acetolactate synthase large subunit-like protein
MYGYELIQELADLLSGDEVVVSTNGNISRQVYHFLPRPQIYLRGSMGLGISVGVGVALSRPKKQVLVITGDGNLLMGLSSLATTSFVGPKNLKILILDNNEYATTGHQQTTSGVLNYASLFEGFGITNLEPIQREDSINIIRERIQSLLGAARLCVLPALVNSDPPGLSNIPWHPEKIAALQRETSE